MSKDEELKSSEQDASEEKTNEELDATKEEKQEEKKKNKSKKESKDEDVEELKEQIAKLKEENLREHADFENMKKRVEKEKYQAISYAHESFARDLLPIIDALENALKGEAQEQSEEVLKQYKEGIELTLEQFSKCFEKHGIKAVSEEGEFDPNIHEAIMKADSKEVESGHIVQTLQKGYTIKDRVLRPAMVSIAN